MNTRLFIAVASLIGLGGSVSAQTRPVTLAWDAARDGSAAGYIVYVGDASGSYSGQYDVGNQTRFTFTEAISGRAYYFAVAAYSSGHLVGPRSEEVFFLSGAVTSDADMRRVEEVAASSRIASSSTTTGPDSFCTSGAACYDVEAVAGFDRPVDSLTVAGDGRLFFIEDRARVRVARNDALLADPMLSAEGTQQFTGLMLDPDFARTGWLYLGVIETRSSGDRELSIVRYREVADVLGEGAVLVAGLPLPQAGDAFLAIDSARRVYAAMPGGSGESRTSRYAGMILRFEADGTAVRSDGPDAPVFAAGYRNPTSLVWAPDANSLWVAGAGNDSDGTVARYATQEAVPPVRYRTATAVAGLNALSTDTTGGTNRAAVVLLDDAGGLSQVLTGSSGASVSPWIPAGALGGLVSAVSNGGGEAIYLAVEASGDPAGSTISILRLRQK